jgi:hypothetical protein
MYCSYMDGNDAPDNHHSLHSDSTDHPTPPTQVPGSHLPRTATAPRKPPRWHHCKGVWLAVVATLALFGSVTAIMVVHHHPNQLAAVPPPSGSACPVNGTRVPLNTTVGDGYFDIKLLRVIYNPPGASSPSPAPGREYLEADFAVTTTPNTVNNTDIGMVYTPSIVPPGYPPCGVFDYPIQGDIPGNPEHSITDSSDFITQDFTPLAPGTTVDVYALFSVPIGDKNGQLEWLGDGGSKTYIFEFH